MRKPLCGAALAAALIFAASAADTALTKKKTPAPTATVHKTVPAAAKTTPKTVHPKTTTAKTSATRTGSHPTTTRRTSITAAARRPLTTWRNRQASPTPDRYRAIQDALVAKGYLQPDDATGRWDQGSVDAMKRFQAEQKLDSTGKIDSLSLIALGLGPRYDSAQSQKPADAAGGGQ